jgi:hypothetical protein
LWKSKLADDGIVALHISNRYLDQAPVLGNIAKAQRLAAAHVFDDDHKPRGKNASEWVVLARKKEVLGPLLKDPRWKLLEGDPRLPLWTDQSADTEPVRKKN